MRKGPAIKLNVELLYWIGIGQSKLELYLNFFLPLSALYILQPFWYRCGRWAHNPEIHKCVKPGLWMLQGDWRHCICHVWGYCVV